jgi:predicted PurR-regulated permease PerM
MSANRPRWSPITKAMVSLLLLAGGIYLLFRFRALLAPLVLALILAYILTPAVNLLQARLRLSRGLVTVICYLVLVLLLVVLPVVVVPVLAAQFTELNQDIETLYQQVEKLADNSYVIAGYTLNPGSLIRQGSGSFQGLLEPAVGQTLSVLVDVVSSVVWLIFIFIVSLYLVKDGPKLRDWFEQLSPPGYRDDFIRLRTEIGQIWSAFFRGQLVLILVVAILFIVIGFVLGMPFALAMGVLAGLLELLPSIGHGIWLFVASILAVSLGSTWLRIPNWVFMLIVISLHLVYQQFDLNYLIPRIIGRSVHLPPLVVILGIVAGAALAGVLGILLAAPTIASARVIGRYIYACLFDLDIFPTGTTPPLPPPDPNWWRRRNLEKPPEIPDQP